jgi:hypothetical protein
MGGHAIGLEAAHIKWFQARGPGGGHNYEH